MSPERTFREKATAMHVFCAQGSFRGGDRYARHWHDMARLAAAGFAESMPDAASIDDRAAVTGARDLAPGGDAQKTQAEDYQRMIENGLLLGGAEPFDLPRQHCQALAVKVNAAVRTAT